MRGGNKTNNFTDRGRSDGTRDFYQHDSRDKKYQYDDNDEGGSSGYTGGNNRSRNNNNNNGQTWKKRLNQSERGNWRGSRRGQRGRSSRGCSNNCDHDTDMSNEKGSRFQQYYKQGGLKKSKFVQHHHHHRSKSSVNENSGWHKITIHNVTAADKDEIMGMIKENIDDIFTPILFEEEGKHLVFYLEKQFQIAKAVITLSGRLRLSNDRKVLITATDTPPRSQKLTENQLKIILNVMSERYSVEMKRLDMKNFHNDQTLIQEQIFCPLHREQILSVLDIIVKHIPDVEEIDFSCNQINSVIKFGSLKECSHLKSLNLENNKLKIIESLNPLKNLSIKELNLSGNMIEKKYSDLKDYRIDVAKYFPKLTLLDGVEIDRPVGFAVEAECTPVPKSRGSFFCNEEVKQNALRFIEQYYKVFESSDRRQLEAAYTEDACFSLSAYFAVSCNSKYIGVYVRQNRNLHVLTVTKKKHSLLSKGRRDVIDTVCKLPIVLHDPHSFIIDIPLATPQLIHVVLMGVFKQVVDSESPIRSFTRSLVIVPVGEGLCISNEELFITTATEDQIRKSFITESASTSSSVSPSVAQSPIHSQASSEAFIGLTVDKIQMIEQFANGSKMLPEYCRICLEQQNWDCAKAEKLFLELRTQNNIPPEYFGRLV